MHVIYTDMCMYVCMYVLCTHLCSVLLNLHLSLACVHSTTDPHIHSKTRQQSTYTHELLSSAQVTTIKSRNYKLVVISAG